MSRYFVQEVYGKRFSGVDPEKTWKEKELQSDNGRLFQSDFLLCIWLPVLWLWSDVRRGSQSEEYEQKLMDMLRDEKT